MILTFDLEDYINSGVIGVNQSPMTPQKWDDLYTTFRATRDAVNRAITEWIQTADICESSCSEKITELKNEYYANYDIFFEKGVVFWEGLVNETYTKEKHKEYSDALENMMYSLRKLLSILEGNKIKF